VTGKGGHKWFRTKTRCCSGITLMTAVMAEQRGPRGMVRSQKVMHFDGQDVYWHWRDQVDRLAEGYGRGL